MERSSDSEEGLLRGKSDEVGDGEERYGNGCRFVCGGGNSGWITRKR